MSARSYGLAAPRSEGSVLGLLVLDRGASLARVGPLTEAEDWFGAAQPVAGSGCEQGAALNGSIEKGAIKETKLDLQGARRGLPI